MSIKACLAITIDKLMSGSTHPSLTDILTCCAASVALQPSLVFQLPFACFSPAHLQHHVSLEEGAVHPLRSSVGCGFAPETQKKRDRISNLQSNTISCFGFIISLSSSVLQG